MKRSLLVVAVVMGLSMAAEARSVRWTAAVQSEQTAATATITLRVFERCRQGGLVGEFTCPGRWRCQGAVCPGRHGRLFFTFEAFHSSHRVVLLAPPSACTAHFVGFGPEPVGPPFHWQYACFDPSTGPDADDRGSFDLELDLER